MAMTENLRTTAIALFPEGTGDDTIESFPAELFKQALADDEASGA